MSPTPSSPQFVQLHETDAAALRAELAAAQRMVEAALHARAHAHDAKVREGAVGAPVADVDVAPGVHHAATPA